MSKWPADFEKYVLEDVKTYPSQHKPVKASIWERLTKNKIATEKAHANPMDEFSWDSVGPSFEIIGDYVEQIRRNDALGIPLYPSPIIVEKMSPDGYMLINGHHRWFAALRVGVPNIWVKIVNLVHSDEIIAALSKTSNHKSAAFDLDEALLVDENNFKAEKPVRLIGRKMIKERLRLGTIKLINGLHEQGYDIWVYTAGYFSEKYISAIFKLYGIKVDGIINGFGRKQDSSAEAIKKKIEEKYTCQLHIDSDGITCIKNPGKEFSQFDLETDRDNWADAVLKTVKDLKG